jgi:nickel-dependent lactate racemase
VFNHNPYIRGTFIGTAALFNTPVFINDKVMACEFRITITGYVHHPEAGFCGGQIILPGVASYETIKYNHSAYNNDKRAKGAPWMGKLYNNDFREDIGLFTQFHHLGSSFYPKNKKIIYVYNWEDVVKFLKQTHGRRHQGRSLSRCY